MFVWMCFVSKLYFVWPKQHVYFPRALRSFHIVKAFLFFFFFNLHHLSFLIHICSLTEVTATQWGVRRVVLQGIPEGVVSLMGSWMRSRFLRPAHLFALGPSRRTAAAPDTAQVHEKFSTRGTTEESHRLGCTSRYGLSLNHHSFHPQTKWNWIPMGWRIVVWPVTLLLLHPLHPDDLQLPAAAVVVVPPLVRTPRVWLHHQSLTPTPPLVLNRPVAAPQSLLQTLFQQGKSQGITSQPKC